MSDILLIDDEPDLLDIIKTELEDAGYSVSCYSEPKKALSAICKEDHGLVISDIRMPKMDGLAVLLNSKTCGCRTPSFVFYTGFSDYSDQELLEAGALQVFKKPLNFQELFDFVDDFFSEPARATNYAQR